MYHIKGGHGRYLRELIRHLEQLDSKNRYTIILQPEGFFSYTPSNPNFRAISTDTHWYTFSEQTKFLRLLNKIRADLVHFPHWNIPLGYRKPFIVTIHDLILIEHPTSAASTRNPLFYWTKYLIFRTILKSALNRAEQIITVSEFTKNQIEEHFPYLDTPITPIHNAATTRSNQQSAISNKTNYQSCAGPRSGIPITNYYLYIGTAYPHKNLSLLLHAFHQFGIRYGRTHKLILAGAKNKFYERLFKTDTARTMLEQGDLVFIDSPNDETLETLYQNATAVVCPSLIEGFGLPPLEAAVRGVPAICSNIPAHQEIMTDAACYFSPFIKEGQGEHLKNQQSTINSLISALHRLTTDNNHRYLLSLKSRKHAKNFSWQKTAEKTLTVIETLSS